MESLRNPTKAFRIMPSAISCTCVVDACAKARRAAEADTWQQAMHTDHSSIVLAAQTTPNIGRRVWDPGRACGDIGLTCPGFPIGAISLRCQYEILFFHKGGVDAGDVDSKAVRLTDPTGGATPAEIVTEKQGHCVVRIGINPPSLLGDEAARCEQAHNLRRTAFGTP